MLMMMIIIIITSSAISIVGLNHHIHCVWILAFHRI